MVIDCDVMKQAVSESRKKKTHRTKNLWSEPESIRAHLEAIIGLRSAYEDALLSLRGILLASRGSNVPNESRFTMLTHCCSSSFEIFLFFIPQII